MLAEILAHWLTKLNRKVLKHDFVPVSIYVGFCYIVDLIY